MLLEGQGLKSRHVSDFSVVETALRALKSYGPRSFASLTSESGSYVQVAGGRTTCLVERRHEPAFQQELAFIEPSKVPFVGTQVLSCGAGKIELQPEEFLFVDDVVAVFEAFFLGNEPPRSIFWRTMHT